MGEMAENQKRQTACKASIGEIARGRYVKEEGWQPNYVETESGRRISRVNTAGIVISAPAEDSGFTNAQIDDGSGTISIRVFDNPDILRSVQTGDPVFIIGRPRQYGSETYILAEIIKKIEDTKWMELRKIELERIKESFKGIGDEAKKNPQNSEPQGPGSKPESQPSPELQTNNQEPKNINIEEEKIEETPEAPKKEELTLPEKVYAMIKEMDSGSGADFEEVVSKAGENSEKIVKSLLMEGEIFEVSPGRLKVLE